jgi:uroporphyrinogen III methyltransferase/synthase
MTGIVYLVGAGPGDPALLTVRGRELVQTAEVVVYDRLVSERVLALAPEAAERIYVGKRSSGDSATQDDINRVLVEKGSAGLRVVRLKGGDPFVFGRGGEEALALADAGVAFEVVPGVTAGVAAPAYAGIPVTHRRKAASVAFVTGHEDPTKENPSADYAALARAADTVVIYMGVGNLAEIARAMIDGGVRADLPAAAIARGTTPVQRTISGTLGDIAGKVRAAGLGPPAIVVVGDVVELHDALVWFERRPLFGRTILVTRARAQTSRLVRRLEELGARVHETPSIRIAEPANPEPLRDAARRAATYDWIVFTSANGVGSFFRCIDQAGRDSRALSGVKVAAIGSATADALRRRGIAADLVPERYVAESMLEAFRSAGDIEGKRVLIPRAAEARDVLPDGLAEMGAAVEVIEAYRTESETEIGPEAAVDLGEGRVDLVTFTSSSTSRNFAGMISKLGVEPGAVTAASIGPITTAAARELGFRVDVEAAEYTIDGLVEAIVERLAAPRRP